MIKKCKVTNIINAPIFGVVEKPIREGDVVNLNSKQILTCLSTATVDEILPSNAVIRLNRDNYKLDNSGITSDITIKDSIIEDAVTPVLDSNGQEINIPEETIVPGTTPEANEILPEEVPTEEATEVEIPVEEVTTEEVTEEAVPVEEATEVEIPTEEVKQNNNNFKKNKKK